MSESNGVEVSDAIEEINIELVDSLADDIFATKPENESDSDQSNSNKHINTAINKNNDETSNDNDSLTHNEIFLNITDENKNSNNNCSLADVENNLNNPEETTAFLILKNRKFQQ